MCIGYDGSIGYVQRYKYFLLIETSISYKLDEASSPFEEGVPLR
ncbi:hypothetical protein HMPREF0973_01269 [Prevotella veroralis F0319]|uniref:Uncharacterized protein n=1 Tax=Prevotella veroralis F0319 TaxID=649761 RepID=C9MNT0_9BACT|nr:hypothetical protein HMPREF0973_01269 [Prevotella veroralis F0319]